MKKEWVTYVSSNLPSPKASISYGNVIHMIYKKPNILLRLFLRMLGCEVKLLKYVEDTK